MPMFYGIPIYSTESLLASLTMRFVLRGHAMWLKMFKKMPSGLIMPGVVVKESEL
jgi:hypothetical protein